MSTWAQFEVSNPKMAEFGLLRIRRYGIGLGFLATVRPDGGPRLAPVCPIFAEGRVYVSAGQQTPKVEDLRGDPRYMLHSFPDQGDPEFSMRGSAIEVQDTQTREAVIAAIDFPAYDREDPIFELDIDRADATTWEHWGTPQSRPVRLRWWAGRDGR